MRYILAITGASGAVLAKRALEYMAACKDIDLHIVVSSNGRKVYEYETGGDISKTIASLRESGASITEHANDNMFAPIASGSFKVDGMLILPCSMSTAGRIANGVGDNLICRAADVCIKEKKKLVISPRETPLSSIHLKNLLTLSESGVYIMPPVPPFYDRREDFAAVIDGITGRVLNALGVDNNLFLEWGTETDRRRRMKGG